ncbi:MAG: hypothetical protein Q8O55_08815 [Dehalococcoidales bacterium]|nr:hypothetical protein [Dehalococcoidales bacterium]
MLSKVLPALGDSLAPYFLKLAELRVKAIKLCEDANALANLFEEEAKRLEQMDKGRSQTP